MLIKTLTHRPQFGTRGLRFANDEKISQALNPKFYNMIRESSYPNAVKYLKTANNEEHVIFSLMRVGDIGAVHTILDHLGTHSSHYCKNADPCLKDLAHTIKGNELSKDGKGIVDFIKQYDKELAEIARLDIARLLAENPTPAVTGASVVQNVAKGLKK